MISVWINGQQRDGLDEGWIARTIGGLRRDGAPICVRVTVVADGVNVAMTAGQCTGGGGGSGRVPNPREREVLDQWAACQSHGGDLTPGLLIQCLRRVERAI